MKFAHDNKWIIPLTAGLFFLLGLGSHLVISQRPSSAQSIVQVREDSPRYKYINPLLYIDNARAIFPEFNPLKEQLAEYISDQVASGSIERASVYYRDLNSGRWTGVHENDQYTPGSMLKIVPLMVFLRLAEEDPNVMNQKLYYDKKLNEGQRYTPEQQLESGYYPVGSLLGFSIIHSDNAANQAVSLVTERERRELYSSLRMPWPPTTYQDYLSPRDISKLYRSLYSATYLSESYSEQALELLTQTKFNKGLTAGVEEGTTVAHKFGEHSVYYRNNIQTPDFQLHDCGIIYYPQKPYFLCVMTEGKDFTNLEEVISSISAQTYSFVKNNRF